MNDLNLFPFSNSIHLKKISSKSEISPEDNCNGYLIEMNEKEARRIIESLKGKNKIIALIGGDDNFNRRAIETLKINYLISPEKGIKKDSLKQRDSGINHVVAKEAVKRNVAFVIDVNEISKLPKEEKAVRLSRIIQNIKICRRAKCEIKIASLAEKKEDIVNEIGRKSIGLSLGMSSEQAKDGVWF
ncbi:MAG: RNase P subunit p30 family protein [Nanoarchaeota archaeon]|nr:RNase P subunit p30 family protein [Nanoarchaeota archaeon]